VAALVGEIPVRVDGGVEGSHSAIFYISRIVSCLPFSMETREILPAFGCGIQVTAYGTEVGHSDSTASAPTSAQKLPA
jgi:hypothetical protein